MALSRTHHQFPMHHHHHHRKRRGGTHANQPGPLRQVHDQEDDLANAMGGGSSRDASEEDNDAFSEHSDSASISSNRQHSRLSSSASASAVPTNVMALPTTARDRALVDSKPGASGSMPQPRRPSGSLNTLMGPAGPSSPSKRPSTLSQSSYHDSQSAPLRRPSNSHGMSAGRDPSVVATLSQAAAALSSSSSVDLSRYGADDEGATSVDDEEKSASLRNLKGTDSTPPSVDTTSASVEGVASGIDSTSLGERRDSTVGASLNLSSLPTWQYQSSTQTNASSTPIGVPTPRLEEGSGRAPEHHGSLSSSSSSTGLHAGGGLGHRMTRSGSDYIDFGSEADSEITPSHITSLDSTNVSSATPSSNARVLPSISTGASGMAGQEDVDDNEVSDDGTASPYDGDVEFAARTSGPSSTAPAGAPLGTSSSTTLVPGMSPLLPSSNQRSEARDVPCRSYHGVYTVQNTPETELRRASPGQHPGSMASAIPSDSKSSNDDSTASTTQELSTDEIYSKMVALNDAQVLATFQSHASSSRVKLYVETDFDISRLSACTSYLRTAKLCLASAEAKSINAAPNTSANGVDIVAGIPAEDDATTAVKLSLKERASLARNCRWVDEVIEGVPRIALGPFDARSQKPDILDHVGARYLARSVSSDDLERPEHQPAWVIRVPKT